jgi:hypothetical protein
MEFNHYSVMLTETIEELCIKPDGVYVDGTLGGGGHAYQVCSRLKNGRFYGIDQDDAAIAAAGERLREFGDKVTILRNNYCNMKAALAEQGRALFAVSRSRADVEAFTAICREKGLTMQETHTVIQNYLRKLSVQFYRYGEVPPDAVAVFGGDTLSSVLATLGGSRLTVMGEVEPGVPVSVAELSGHKTLLITKAGDVGSEELLEKIGALCGKTE